jgi:hypothetical protein
LQSGQTAIPLPRRTVTTIVSAAFDTLSMTNPLGTSEEIRKLARMALILRGGQRKLASEIHQI